MSRRRRALSTLVRADLGNRVQFVSETGRHVAGTIRTFTHGIYSRPERGEVDRPMCLVIVRTDPPMSCDEGHWATPDTKAEIAPATSPSAGTERSVE